MLVDAMVRRGARRLHDDRADPQAQAWLDRTATKGNMEMSHRTRQFLGRVAIGRRAADPKRYASSGRPSLRGYLFGCPQALRAIRRSSLLLRAVTVTVASATSEAGAWPVHCIRLKQAASGGPYGFGWLSGASSSMLRRMVNESLDTIRNWERSGGTLRVVHLSDIDALVDLCACTGERMDSLKSSDRELLAYLNSYATNSPEAVHFSGYEEQPEQVTHVLTPQPRPNTVVDDGHPA